MCRKVYRLRRIFDRSEIEACEKAMISEASWTCVVRPEAWAYMGYLDGEGLLIRMACRERNPRRVCSADRDPVWKDSALEVFLAFFEEEDANRPFYLNFELNANGALFAQSGFNRLERDFVPEQVYRECGCRAWISEELWSVELLIPQWYLREACRWEYGCESNETSLYCNFYKISETPEIEHYLSYSRVESETPDFHQPIWFAKAVKENWKGKLTE